LITVQSASRLANEKEEEPQGKTVLKKEVVNEKREGRRRRERGK
jgi:hypothetical protein